MTRQQIDRVRKINATKAHGHIDSAVSHCADLLAHIDEMDRSASKLRSALKEAIEVLSDSEWGGEAYARAALAEAEEKA